MSNTPKPHARSRAGLTGAARIARFISAVAVIAPAVAKVAQRFAPKPEAEPKPAPAPAPQINISDSDVQIVTSERPVIKWGPRRVPASYNTRT